MASQQNSREYTALRKNVSVLAGVVALGKIPSLLFENELIDDEIWSLVCDRTTGTALTNRGKGESIMVQVLQAVKGDSTLFEVFCTALDTERAGKEASQKVRGRPD